MCYEKNAKNVLGTQIVACSNNPVTGYYRDGYCKTFNNDIGEHIICCEVTNDFLLFSKSRGNDLITAVPEYNFMGLKEGDRWCLCASRWIEALDFKIAPKILLIKPNANAFVTVSSIYPRSFMTNMATKKSVAKELMGTKSMFCGKNSVIFGCKYEEKLTAT